MKDNDYLDILANLIKREMEYKGFNYAEMARRTGLSERAISYIVNRRRNPTYTSVMRIFYALGYVLEARPINEEINNERIHKTT